MQSSATITNTTDYITKFLVKLDGLNAFIKYMVSPSAREIIQQFFSNYDENACLSIFAYPADMYLHFFTAGHLLNLSSLGFLGSTLEDGKGYVIKPEYSNERTRCAYFRLLRRHNNFLDFAPYTKMQLYLPCVGTIDIDPAAWYGKIIDIYYVIDFENGGITYFAQDSSTGIEIGSWQGQYGVEIAATSTRLGEIKTQAVTGTITGAIEMATGNLAGGAATAATSAMSWFNAPAGVSGGRAGNGIAHAFDDANVYIIETYVDPVDDEESFAEAHGLPLYQKRDFADLSGYTVIDQVHLQGLGTATEGEKQEIETLLKAGVHF